MRGVTHGMPWCYLGWIFQPALPMRGVTSTLTLLDELDLISTRTPHAGSDGWHRVQRDRCGFQPALPMRGVTPPCAPNRTCRRFQPALPMRGVTSIYSMLCTSYCSFQPALPMRGVTKCNEKQKLSLIFQPALPMRGVTTVCARLKRSLHISTRTPHAGSDQVPASRPRPRSHFNPHSPCGE